MMSLKPFAARQRGAVLITSLMLLVMLTIIAVVANQSTVLEARMSTNSIVKSRAVESSEALRMGSNELVDTHLFYRGWPQKFAGSLSDSLFDIPTGLVLTNVNNWGTGNGAGEDLFTPSTLVKDMEMRLDGNNDGDYLDDVDQRADLYVYKTVVINTTGSANAMVAGYEGLGKSSASGGAQILFDMRSIGSAASNAEGITGSNYRYVIRN